MSDALVPTITNGGLLAAVNAKNNGLQATIAAIGVGTGIVTNGIGTGYQPSAQATALQSEQIRVPILTGTSLQPAGFRVLAQIPSKSAPASYTVWEVGFYLDTGLLFALWSSTAFPLAAKTGLADIDLAFDLYLEQLPEGSMDISVVEPLIPDTAAVMAELLAQQANLFSAVLKMNSRLIAHKI